MPIHQRHPQVKVLCQAHNRVIDGAVAVGVELTHDFAHHAGAFYVPFVGPEPHFAHHIDDAPLHRLETVAGIWQGAGINHRIGVFQEGSAHFLGHVDMSDVFLGSLAFWRCSLLRLGLYRSSCRGRLSALFLGCWLVEFTASRHSCRKQVRLTGVIRLFIHLIIKAKNLALVRFGSRI